ncbi:MAG: Uma2 family endonuclease [Emergencia sp.]
MNIQEMKRRKAELGYSNEQVAKLSGVPLGTVQKIFAGITRHPRYDTLQALDRFFRDAAAGDPAVSADSGVSEVCESGFAYTAKKQGEYTLEDYYALPEERRAELIDGILYDMTAPSFIHQQMILAMAYELNSFIRGSGGSCICSVAPTDVRLNMDEKTMVQPDVFIVCDRDKIGPHRLEGAPDFIIEVLSPSTGRKDSLIKLQKYADAGVREYWLVDPDRKRIVTYVFEEDDFLPSIYSFTDQVPVAIFDGKCRIDFGEIYAQIRFLYET